MILLASKLLYIYIYIYIYFYYYYFFFFFLKKIYRLLSIIILMLKQMFIIKMFFDMYDEQCNIIIFMNIITVQLTFYHYYYYYYYYYY